jgi:hypothetical protein
VTASWGGGASAGLPHLRFRAMSFRVSAGSEDPAAPKRTGRTRPARDTKPPIKGACITFEIRLPVGQALAAHRQPSMKLDIELIVGMERTPSRQCVVAMGDI